MVQDMSKHTLDFYTKGMSHILREELEQILEPEKARWEHKQSLSYLYNKQLKLTTRPQRSSKGISSCTLLLISHLPLPLAPKSRVVRKSADTSQVLTNTS